MALEPAPRFSTEKLDLLLDRFGIDVLVVTSKHNIPYLLGGSYPLPYAFLAMLDIKGLL